MKYLRQVQQLREELLELLRRFIAIYGKDSNRALVAEFKLKRGLLLDQTIIKKITTVDIIDQENFHWSYDGFTVECLAELLDHVMKLIK